MSIALAIALIAAAAALAFTWQPTLASLYDDSVSYLVMAQAFAPYGEAGPAIAAAFRSEIYPPVFPVAIALAGGAYDWTLAHALVAAAFGLSVVTLALVAREMTESDAVAIAASVVYVLMPGTWLNIKGILTEFPYMALSFGALALYLRLGHRLATRGSAFLVAAVVAAAILTRPIGVALVAAIAFAEGVRFLRDRDRARVAAWLPAAVALAAGVALWYVLRPSGSGDEYVSRSTGVLQALADRPADVMGLVTANAAAIRDAWLNALLIYWGEPGEPKYLIACALGAIGLAATLYRLATGAADAAYIAAFVAILLVWPFPGQMYRLAWPVLPLLLVEALWAVARVSERLLDARRADWLAGGAALVALAVCVPAIGFIALRAREPSRVREITEFYRIPARPAAQANAAAQLEVMGDLARIRDTTPAGASVMWYAPAYVALLSRRRAIPMDVIERPAELVAQVRSLRPDYLYFSTIHPRDSGWRHGNPLAPWVHARPFCDVVWARTAASGELQAVLLKVRERP